MTNHMTYLLLSCYYKHDVVLVHNTYTVILRTYKKSD